MKLKILKVFYMAISAAIIFAAFYSLNFVYAQDEDEVLIKNKDEGYELIAYKDGDFLAPVYFPTLGECLSNARSMKIYFQNVKISKNVKIENRDFVFSGNLELSEYSTLELENSDISFMSLTLSSSGGKIRIKSGKLSIVDSQLVAEDKALILLDHSANAYLEFLSGKIISKKGNTVILFNGSS